MTFLHRNGETTPPTVNGWYGYDGAHRNAKFGGQIFAEGVSTRGFVLVDGDEYYRFVWVGDDDQTITDFIGRWWGPVVLPWEQPAPAAPTIPDAVRGLTVNEYQLSDDSSRIGGITLRRMPQRDGAIKWAIYDGGNVVLSKEYEDGDPWEYEPLPSSRDDEYLARCRFDSIKEALQHWQKWLDAQRGTAQEPTP